MAELDEEGTPAGADAPAAPDTAAAASGHVHLTSTLKKKNRLGFWQSRYFELQGDQLTYYKNKSSKTPLHPAQKVEYCQLDDRFGSFSLQTDQKEFALLAPSLQEAQQWVLAAEQAENDADKAEILREFQASKLGGKQTAAAVVLAGMEGYLQMRSASRVKGWKDGFFRLEPCMMVYYKDNVRQVEDYESQIVFTSSSTLEKKPEKPMQFKLKTSVNSYTFKAPSVDACNDWMVALQTRINLSQSGDDAEEERLAELIEAPPKWMVDWDNRSNEDNVIQVQNKLIALFNRGGEASLQHTLNAVTALIEELEDKARECLPLNGQTNAKTESGRSESRADIFQIILRFYHIRIVDELSHYVSLDQEYEQFSLRELLSCMDLISAYNNKLSEIFKGEVGAELEEKIPPFGMMDNAENMATVYLEKCEVQINGWVDNVTETSSRKVEIRTDGKFQTTSPALLLNLLNEALVLAARSGMKRLQTEVLALCAVSLGDFMHATVSSLHKTSSFSYCIACANDCWSVMDYIGNFLKSQTNDEYDVSFMALEEKSAAEADRCLGVIVSMVQDDLGPVLQTAFTSKHLESQTVREDTMAIVCATCDDYLESFCEILEMAFVIRLARMMMGWIVATYLARFGVAYRDEALRSLTKKQVELIKLDRNRLTECLRARLPDYSLQLISPEFGALDDVLDMLTSPVAYVPQTVIKLVQSNEMLRDHVREIGKMMIELSPQASAESAKEVKALLEPELARVPKPENQIVETDPTNPFVKMWPLKAKKQPLGTIGGSSSRGLSRADSKAQLVRDTVPVQKLESANSERIKRELMHKQQSAQWAPPTKQLSSAMLEQTVTLQAVLQFATSVQTGHMAHACVIRKAANGSEYELAVFQSPTVPSGTIVFQAKMSDISRIEFCEGDRNTPMIVVEDGTAKKDAIAFSRSANTKAEFSVIKKQGQSAHFLVDGGGPGATSSKWVKELQLHMRESFNKPMIAATTGPIGAEAPKVIVAATTTIMAETPAVVKTTPVSVDEESYSDMSTKQLKELGRLRKLDMKGCVERGELIAILEQNDLESMPQSQLVSALKKTSSIPGDAGRKASVKFSAPQEEVLVAAPVKNAPTPVVAAPVVAAPVAALPPVVAAPPVVVVAPLSNLLDSDEEKIVEIQMLIFQGHSLVEDGNPRDAVPLFKNAKEEAEKINNTQLKAKASTGLASAYRDMPQMRRAAAPLFEVAATLFGSTGDTSDRINVLSEAADIYVSQGEFPQAIRCLTRFDKAMVQAGSLPVFAARIQEIQAML
ncbi:hypothetical protein BASA81_001242 [Batrachochytrium salamandrivorans]|nr:hypothetical protein BASA81_001242 [Batrachochytrium salamandrivorans]